MSIHGDMFWYWKEGDPGKRRAPDTMVLFGVPMDPSAGKREAAPVVVYFLDKHKRDMGRFTEALDGADIPYRMISLEGDAATIEAVRRDAGGRKLPLVFIAGDCIGGREELNAMDRSGELKKRVFGA